MIFGQNEFTHPMRMLTTTVKIEGQNIHRLPVISTTEVPKEKLKDLVKKLYKLTVKSPIKRGDVIVKNIDGTGADIIATRTIQ